MQTIESSPLGNKIKGEAVHLSQLVSSSCVCDIMYGYDQLFLQH